MKLISRVFDFCKSLDTLVILESVPIIMKMIVKVIHRVKFSHE